MNKYLLIISLLFLSSCYTEYFKINNGDNELNFISGYNMSGYKEVELIVDNGKDALLLKNNSTVSLKNKDQTQFTFQSYFKLVDGNNFTINLRSTRDKFHNDSGITIKISENEVLSFENGQIIQDYSNLKLNQNQYYKLRVLSDGKRVKVFIDCDEILDYRTILPATEYVIISSEDTKLIFNSLQFIDIYPQNLNAFDSFSF